MSKIKLKAHKTESSFKNKKKVAQAITEALLDGDSEAVQDILYGYLSTQNKKELAEKSNLSRSTIYNAIKGNPSLKTLVEILKQVA
jgi:DNA-binding phage protein